MSEPKHVSSDLKTPARVWSSELSSEPTGRECFFNKGNGCLNALQCERHSFSCDWVQESRAITNEEESGPVDRLYREA